MCVTDNMLLCVAAVQRINEVFSAVNDEFDEFSYGMKVYRYVTLFLNKCTHIFDLTNIVMTLLWSFWDSWNNVLEFGCCKLLAIQLHYYGQTIFVRNFMSSNFTKICGVLSCLSATCNVKCEMKCAITISQNSP